MKMVPGGMVRTTTNLNLRAGPGVQQPRLATLQKNVLARILAAPAAGWVEVEVNGHTLDGKKIYSEPDERSSIEATRGLAAEWREITLTGYVATGHLEIVDGPA